MLNVNLKSGEILIYDVIGRDWLGEGVTAEGVIEALDKLGDKRAIVRINSPGGSADEGIAIYNALKRHPGGVDTYNDSVAASAASLAFLAGQKRTMAKGAKIMIHRAMSIAIGNAPKMRKAAETLETYDASIVDIYSEFFANLKDQDILKLMDDETWYNTAEAIETGLATDLVPTKAVAANVANWFRHMPDDIEIDWRYETSTAKAIAMAKKIA